MYSYILHEYMHHQVSEEGIRSFRVGVTGGCEMPQGSVNQTHVLCKSSKHFQLLSTYSFSCFCFIGKFGKRRWVEKEVY